MHRMPLLRPYARALLWWVAARVSTRWEIFEPDSPWHGIDRSVAPPTDWRRQVMGEWVPAVPPLPPPPPRQAIVLVPPRHAMSSNVHLGPWPDSYDRTADPAEIQGLPVTDEDLLAVTEYTRKMPR